MMKNIGRDMHEKTECFSFRNMDRGQPRVLDFCMAPGGFLSSALAQNPSAYALAFSLPVEKGGHEVLLPISRNVNLRFLDITMLAADMGVTEIPEEHADAKNFLRTKILNEPSFDLVICDGQVLRTHARAEYREKREARRLTVTQLALGLQHIKQGGTMIILLHKLEATEVAFLLYTLSKISSVATYKHAYTHAKRSSFYAVASKIQRDNPQTEIAIESYKRIWKAATFGTDEEYYASCKMEDSEVETLLRSFGPQLCRLAKKVFKIQTEALKKAPFIRNRN